MDVMIDLETLGTSADAVITSIGLVIFDIDNKKIIDKYYAVFNLDSQLKKGRKVEAGTLSFWLSQPNKAKDVFKETKKPVDQILNEINTLLDKYRPLDMWANGTDFDLSMMQDIYRMYEISIPWAYNKKNDLRTFIRFVGNKEKLPKTDGDHNALNDAVKQVEYIFKHYKKSEEKVSTTDTVSKPKVPQSLLDDKGELSQVIIDQIAEESREASVKYAPKGTTEKGIAVLEGLYAAGAVEWAFKFEANSKKMWNLIEAFRQADQSMMGKELTEQLMKDSMTAVRDAIGEIVGEKGLHG